MRSWWERWAEKWLCDWAGWHTRPYHFGAFDGCSMEATCTRCGYRGLVDSQGNLF